MVDSEENHKFDLGVKGLMGLEGERWSNVAKCGWRQECFKIKHIHSFLAKKYCISWLPIKHGLGYKISV